jgi:hypothetical protein
MNAFKRYRQRVCAHDSLTIFIPVDLSGKTRIIKKLCNDCGKKVSKIKEHIAPVKGIIDEYKAPFPPKPTFAEFESSWLSGKPVGGA